MNQMVTITVTRPSVLCVTHERAVLPVYIENVEIWSGDTDPSQTNSAQRVGFFNIGSGRAGYWTKYQVAGRVRVG